MTQKELQQEINYLMLDLGIPAHLNGFQYIKSSIEISIDNMDAASRPTKVLYPEIAKQYKTSSERAERAIRNAIEVSWSRGNTNLFETIFGYSRKDGSSRPTNSEYIANISDFMRVTYSLV